MNDIEVGEYVRTNNGYIRKVTNNDLLSRKGCYLVDKIYYNEKIKEDTLGVVVDEDITKHSKNIIDVLEVGDYVNGSRIMDADSLTGYMKEIYLEEAPDDGVWCEEIKTVLTHEQYEANAYRLEE